MANLKASIKGARQSETNAIYNARMKRRFKETVKEFNKKVDTGLIEEAKAYLPRVYKMVDKAAKQNIINKGNAARRKSRLTAKLNKAALNVKASE